MGSLTTLLCCYCVAASCGFPLHNEDGFDVLGGENGGCEMFARLCLVESGEGYERRDEEREDGFRVWDKKYIFNICT